MWWMVALLAALFWGINYTLTEKILSNIAPVTLLALEALVSALTFSIMAYFSSWPNDRMVLINNPKILWLTIIETIVVLAASFCIVFSISSKNATVTSVIELIYPLFIVFFTWLFFGENHLSVPVVVGGILIFVGVLVISLNA
ncbi:MAG: EamA family transporter [Legionella sp.]